MITLAAVHKILQKHLRSISFSCTAFLSRSLPVYASTCSLRLHLPLPEQVADGGVLCWQGAGQEWHQAPEALPQLLHVFLQAVDVWVQLPPAALHLRQHVIHQALHLRVVAHGGPCREEREKKASEHIRCYLVEVLTGCDFNMMRSLASLTLQRSTRVFPWSASILFSIFTRLSLGEQCISGFIEGAILDQQGIITIGQWEKIMRIDI